MEKNTYATSFYIDAPLRSVKAYLMDGMSLNEYTLFSRMERRIDDTTWLGTASGYQNGLYYHARQHDLDEIQIVEWHCGKEPSSFFHVYPMLMFAPSYFGSSEQGTYYHWISFVDPARRTQMITEGLPTVHRSEARSLKAHLERRAGRDHAIAGALDLASHTIYVEAPVEAAYAYLADPANAAEWGYLFRRDGSRHVDLYGRELEISIQARDLGAYRLVDYTTRYVATGEVIRSPMLLIPCAYAFAAANAPGFILHRMTAWPRENARTHGKTSTDDYDTEAINAKRIIEARAGNLAAYARGCSYRAPEKT